MEPCALGPLYVNVTGFSTCQLIANPRSINRRRCSSSPRGVGAQASQPGLGKLRLRILQED